MFERLALIFFLSSCLMAGHLCYLQKRSAVRFFWGCFVALSIQLLIAFFIIAFTSHTTGAIDRKAAIKDYLAFGLLGSVPLFWLRIFKT